MLKKYLFCLAAGKTFEKEKIGKRRTFFAIKYKIS